MDVVDLTFSDDEDKNFVDLTTDGDEGIITGLTAFRSKKESWDNYE